MIEPRTPDAFPSARRGPGERIRAARVKAGHDLDWAAAQLRLRKPVIEALEDNDYDNLPPPVFVQGYLRTYADLLGLPAEEVLNDYKDAAGMRAPEPASTLPLAVKAKVSPEKRKENPKEKSRDQAKAKPAEKPRPGGEGSGAERLASRVTRALAKSRREAEPEPRPQPVQKPAPEPIRQEPVLTKPEPVAKPEPVVEPEVEIPPPTVEKLPALEPFGLDRERDKSQARRAAERLSRSRRSNRTLPAFRLPPGHLVARWVVGAGVVALVLVVGSWGINQLGKIRIRSPEVVIENLKRQFPMIFGENSSAPPAPTTGPADSGQPPPMSITPIQPLSEDAQLLEPPPLTDSLPEPVMEEVPAEAAPANGQEPKRILLEMKGNSWVEIEDATGEYRLVGELKKGELHELKGKPPYRVLFGRSNMVNLTVNGEPFDFSRLQRGSVARFSLDP